MVSSIDRMRDTPLLRKGVNKVALRLFEHNEYVEDDKFLAIKEERKIVKKHGLDIPYVDIHFDKDALIGITLSPTLKLADERSEILKIAKDNGYSNVTADSVCASEIPVRF